LIILAARDDQTVADYITNILNIGLTTPSFKSRDKPDQEKLIKRRDFEKYTLFSLYDMFRKADEKLPKETILEAFDEIDEIEELFSDI
jgi:hypothetical protein